MEAIQKQVVEILRVTGQVTELAQWNVITKSNWKFHATNIANLLESKAKELKALADTTPEK
jgi:hypothetical protein